MKLLPFFKRNKQPASPTRIYTELNWSQTDMYAQGCFGFHVYPHKNGYCLEAHWIDKKHHDCIGRALSATQWKKICLILDELPLKDIPEKRRSDDQIFVLDATETSFIVHTADGDKTSSVLEDPTDFPLFRLLTAIGK